MMSSQLSRKSNRVLDSYITKARQQIKIYTQYGKKFKCHLTLKSLLETKVKKGQAYPPRTKVRERRWLTQVSQDRGRGHTRELLPIRATRVSRMVWVSCRCNSRNRRKVRSKAGSEILRRKSSRYAVLAIISSTEVWTKGRKNLEI